MIQYQRHNYGQLAESTLLLSKPPNFDHVFKKLQMDITVRKTFVFKQKIDVSRGLAKRHPVQHIRIIILQIRFNKAVFADLKGIKPGNVQNLPRQVVLQKRPCTGKIAPRLSEKLVMGMVQVGIHVPELSGIRRFSKRQISDMLPLRSLP